MLLLSELPNLSKQFYVLARLGLLNVPSPQASVIMVFYAMQPKMVSNKVVFISWFFSYDLLD